MLWHFIWEFVWNLGFEDVSIIWIFVFLGLVILICLNFVFVWIPIVWTFWCFELVCLNFVVWEHFYSLGFLSFKDFAVPLC